MSRLWRRSREITGPPHLDAGRIYRLTPFEEVVTELRKVLAASVVPGVAGSNGLYALLGEDGSTVATFDHAALTARRTPAVSALATDALARDDVRRLAVFGTDVQAREHVRAMRWIRPSLERIEIVGHEPVATERFVAMLRGEGHPAVVAGAADASGADLICTCTSTPAPILIDSLMRAGTHINAVNRGSLPPGRVVHDLVALARGQIHRDSPDETTIFVPPGLAVEDLAVATLAARNAGLID